MIKCKCYEECTIQKPLYNRFTGLRESYFEVTEGHCNGTRERDICYCNGDRLHCTHYPEVIKEAKEKQEIEDLKKNKNNIKDIRKELEITKQFIKENNLEFELLNYFEKYKER